MQRRNKKATMTMLCLLLAVFLCMSFTACNGVIPSSPQNPPAVLPKASAFVCVDINPSIEFVLDQYGRVMSAAGANADGQVILWEEDGIVGADLQFAIKKITALAQKYGYLCDGNDTVNVSVCTEDAPDSLFESISCAIKDASVGLDVKIVNGLDLVLSSDLALLKKSDSENEVYSSLTVEKYRLIKRAVDYDRSLSFDGATLLSTEQLLSIVQRVQSDSATKLGKIYENAVAEAQFAYECEKQLLLDDLFVQYFTDKAARADGLRNIAYFAKKAVYAANYKVLRNTHLLLTHYLSAIENNAADYSLENVQTICDLLSGVLEISVDDVIENVKDINGQITLNGINSYLNGIYRNIAEDKRGEFAQTYEKIKAEVLDRAELNDESIAEISSAISSIYDGETQMLPNIIKDFVEDSLFEIYVPDIDYGDADEVKYAVDALEFSINQAYENMRLTDDDLKTIAEMQIALANSISNLKEELNEQINRAKENAAQLLSNKKKDLIDKSTDIFC